MEPWQRGWEQIGGPNALTRWSWILTLPLALLISNSNITTATVAEFALWMGMATFVHVLAGVAMWIAWVSVLSRRSRRSRPITALVVFAAIGTLRGLLMQAAQDVSGIGGSLFLERMGLNIFGSVVVLAAIAIVVDDFRVDAVIKTRLQEAERTLAQVLNLQDEALRAADRDVLDQVQAAVEAALSESGATPERSREVSEEIVRPISHHLVESHESEHVIANAGDPRQVRLTFAEAFAATAAPSPLAVALLIEVTVIGAVLGRFGIQVAIANLVLGGVAIYLGGRVFRKYVRLPRALPPRIFAIALGFAVVGAVASVLAPAIITLLIAPFNPAVLSPTIGTALAALIISFGTAVVTGRRQRLDQMAQTVAESAQSLEHLQARIRDRRLKAARFLHGAIQGELVAAALKGDRPEDVRQVITRRFSEYGSHVSAGRSEQQVADVISAWSAVLEVTFSADPDVWQVLDRDTERALLIIDALSEGLTNVVRHATGRDVIVALTCEESRVSIAIESQGIDASPGDPGIGLEQLRARGSTVELSRRADRTQLTVTV